MGLEFGISKLTLEDRIDFFRTLSSWLTTGGGSLPVNEAVRNTCEAFSRDEYRSLRGAMDRIVHDYNSGQVKFYQSLSQANIGFEQQEIGIVRAAEDSNQLRVAVPALVDALAMRYSATKLLKGKLTMPIVGGFMLIILSLGVLLVMLPMVMGPVVEKDPTVLEKFPAIIAGYWYASVWMRANVEFVVAMAVSPVVLFLVRNTPYVKPYVERGLMAWSPTRRIIVAFNAVLVVFFMPALVRANMPLPDVLRTLANSLNNTSIKVSFRRAAMEHEQGYKLADVLTGLPFRGSFRSAVEAGEKTGKIAERVEDLRVPYQTEFERIVKKSVAVLTMIVMAVLMPFFIISVYTSLVAPMIALMEAS